jgi:TolB protein
VYEDAHERVWFPQGRRVRSSPKEEIQMRRSAPVSLIAVAMAAALVVVATSMASAGSPTTRVVSINSDEFGADGSSADPSISANGRYIAFESDADNLSTEDNDSYRNIFVHDRDTRATAAVSLTSGGAGGDSHSFAPAISANGRYVAFASHADNFSGRDESLQVDVFVHDRTTRTTILVSRRPDGNGANGPSEAPSISANGRYIAFESDADNLSTGDNNSYRNVFVYDRDTRKTVLVSRTSGGIGANDHSGSASISADGRYVAFRSAADNLSAADDNGVVNVFVHDREKKKTFLISRTSGGAAADGDSTHPSISADGRVVAFRSLATNLSSADNDVVADVFAHDRETKKTTLVSRTSSGAGGDGVSYYPSVSANGRFVAFGSAADNLSTDDNNSFQNVFVHDRTTGATRLVSRTSSGIGADGLSYEPSISGNGRYVAFRSDADNLSGIDNNGVSNVFLHGPLA